MGFPENTTKYENKKNMIIEKAIDLFGSKGFRGTSIRDIAKSVDMSISSIYHYFGNKEGLMLAVLEYSTYKMLANLKEVSSLAMDPLDRFKLLIRTNVHQTVEHMKRAKIIDIDEEHLTPDGYETRRLIQREILDIYMKELRILEELGYVNVRSLSVLAFNILSMVNWLIRWYRVGGKMSVEEVSEEIISFVLYGIIGSRPGQKDEAIAINMGD